MPDIRTLLDDLTTRVPAPDPVGSVHAAVRRRTVRRSLAATACTVAAVGAVFATVAVARVDTAPPAATIQPSPRTTVKVGTPEPTPASAPTPDKGAFASFIEVNPNAFLGWTEDEAGNAVVQFAPGVDRAEWKQRLDEASGGYPFTEQSCPKPPSYYDDLIAEVDAFRWPSGAKPTSGAAMNPGAGCQVAAWLDNATAADRAAARERWGDAVHVW